MDQDDNAGKKMDARLLMSGITEPCGGDDEEQRVQQGNEKCDAGMSGQRVFYEPTPLPAHRVRIKTPMCSLVETQADGTP
jgi:hypothetical protein